EPTAQVKRTKDAFELIVRSRNLIYRIVGSLGDAPTPKRKVVLAQNGHVDLGQVLPEAKTEEDLVHEAIERRYLREVKHCADHAQRARWKTDDPRFIKC